MTIIDVPVRDEQGNLKFTASLTPEQTQLVLQFGLNMALAMGMAGKFVGDAYADSTFGDVTNRELDD